MWAQITSYAKESTMNGDTTLLSTIRRTVAISGGVAVVLALAVAGCTSDVPDDPGGSPSTSASPSGTSTGDATTSTGEPSEPTPTSTEDAGSGEISGVPVYYVGDSGGSFRLYREWRAVPDLGDPVESAVMAMMSLPPVDPDYASPWVAPDEIEVEREGSAITVDVPGAAFTGSVGSELSAVALQQLVYTATAASTLDGPAAATVTILMDGSAADAWGHVRVGDPMTRAPQAEVLSHVWVLEPGEGAVVEAGEVLISGYGTSFEANFVWRVEGPAGSQEGFTLSDNGTGFGELSFAVELEPGTYTVTVESTSGLGEFVPHTDSKTFTVR